MSPTLVGDALDGSAVFTDGDWVESKDQDPNGDVRLVQLADIGLGEFLDKSSRYMTGNKAADLRCTYLEPGDVLVARMPDPIGRACIFPGDRKPCVTVVDVCVIRPDASTVDSRWLVHWFNSPSARGPIDRSATGTTRKRISRKNIEKLAIDLPPIEEQRRIAAVLDAADALRAKRRQATAKLDSLTQAIFIDMFGDPYGPDVPTIPLMDIADLLMGQSPPGHSYNDSGEGIPLLNGPSEFGPRYPTAVQWTIAPTRMSVAGDILFCVRGATAGRMNWSDGEYCLGRGLAAIRTDPNNRAFLYRVLDAHYSRFQATGTGSTFINISKKDLQDVPIPVASDETIAWFGEARAQIDYLAVRGNSVSERFETLFDSLQQRAFRGEL